jgi:hypothetical protein
MILGKENAIDGIGVRFPGSLLWHRECRGSFLILGIGESYQPEFSLLCL